MVQVMGAIRRLQAWVHDPKKRPVHRRVAEIAVAVLTLVVIVAVTSFVNPFIPSSGLGGADSSAASGQTTYRAMVEAVGNESATVTLLDGPQRGTSVEASVVAANDYGYIREGSVVVVSRASQDSGNEYVLTDSYRLPVLIIVCAIFAFCVLLIGRKRGFTSLIGLALSIGVIALFLIPQLKNGGHPLLLCGLSAYMIAFSSIIIAHGIRLRTLVSIGCVAVLLIFVITGDALAVHALSLTGLTDETTTFLATGGPGINTSGLLAGGLVIASLGALDDIVTSQVAAVDELRKANSRLSVRELYVRSLSIGSEHIAALVNTLALIYAGASLPVLLTLAGIDIGLAELLNTETLTTAIIEATIPGIALVLAVPFSGVVAAIVLHRIRLKGRWKALG